MKADLGFLLPNDRQRRVGAFVRLARLGTARQALDRQRKRNPAPMDWVSSPWAADRGLVSGEIISLLCASMLPESAAATAPA